MDIKTLGVIGAGTMGSAIALQAARHGFTVTLTDASVEATEAARDKASKTYGRWVDKGRLEQADADAALERLVAGDLGDIGKADLIVEAVFEDFEIKQAMLRELAGTTNGSPIVATNTSALRVSALAEAWPDPTRFLGLHYFSPAEVNPVCELVRGHATSDETVAAARGFLRATERIVINCADQYGFCVNRFFCPYTNAAGRALDRGLATPAGVDAIARETFALPAGPFQVLNIIKPRINLNAIRNLSPLGDFYAPAEAMITTGESGGAFDLSDEQVHDADAVRDLLLAETFLPVLQLLDEEVATPASVDLGAEAALKFGKPPCRLMNEMGRARVAALVTPVCEAYGIAVPESLERVGALTSS